VCRKCCRLCLRPPPPPHPTEPHIPVPFAIFCPRQRAIKKNILRQDPKAKKKPKTVWLAEKKNWKKKTKLQTKNYKQQKVIKVEFRLGSPVELINLLYPLHRKNAKAEKHFSCPVSQLDLRIFKNSITVGGWLSRDLECELKTFFRSEYLKILLLKLSRVLNPTKSPWNHLAD